jgi:Mg2+/Co2+ transporter CorC
MEKCLQVLKPKNKDDYTTIIVEGNTSKIIKEETCKMVKEALNTDEVK